MEWFKNLKTAHKIIGLIIVMVFFLVSIGAIGLFSQKNAIDALGKVDQISLPTISVLNTVLKDVLDVRIHSLELTFVENQAKQKEIVANITKLREEYNKKLTEYEKNYMHQHEDDKKLYEETVAKLENYRKYNAKIIELATQGKVQEAQKAYWDSENSFDEFQESLEKLVQIGFTDTDDLVMSSEATGKKAEIVIIVSIVISLLLSIGIGLVISKIITNPINEMLSKVKEIAKGNLTVDKINYISKDEIGELGTAFNVMTDNLRKLVENVMHSVEEISAGSEEMSAATEQTAQGAQQVATSITQLATGSQEQASSVTGCLENINKISKAIQLISENSGETVNISKNTETNADAGRIQAAKAVEKINQIKVTSVDTSKTIKDLGKLSSDIEVIVDLIKNIAGQTNLLALNAAIEAARAGEHGKGFAVVADEVKKLASQSAEATDKITGMIKEIQNKATEAVTAMDNGVNEVEDGVVTIESVGEALESILNAAKEASGNIQEISTEVNSLARNSDNVVKMMEDISSITEESSASAEEISSITEEQTASLEEISASSQSLAKIAENLQKQVAIFKV